ncbi:MAG TPA: hypothetical protein VKP30_13325 [Polyangiaceae bacterium]|nr:hypothetical protein [Polyangiaceae bacterium]
MLYRVRFIDHVDVILRCSEVTGAVNAREEFGLLATGPLYGVATPPTAVPTRARARIGDAAASTTIGGGT